MRFLKNTACGNCTSLLIPGFCARQITTAVAADQVAQVGIIGTGAAGNSAGFNDQRAIGEPVTLNTTCPINGRCRIGNEAPVGRPTFRVHLWQPNVRGQWAQQPVKSSSGRYPHRAVSATAGIAGLLGSICTDLVGQFA